VGGLDKFVEILDMVDAKVRNEIIGFLAKDNPELVEKIKQRTFTFEQVSDLDTQSLRVVLGEINTSDLAIALRRAPDNVKQRITMNLSEGGVALLREEMEFGKPATDARIEQEQAKIIGIVRRMEAEGKISIKKRDRVLLETEEYEKGKRVKLDAEEETSPSGKDTGALNNEMAFEHYNAGMEYYNAGNMNESVEEFRKSLEYNDTVWQTYQYLGSCYYSLGMEKEAIAAYRKALDLNPDNEELSEWLEARAESVEE